MKLKKIKIQKDKIRAFAEHDKVLFIAFSNLFNEINILIRTLRFSNKSTGTAVETAAQNSQTLFFLELLAGKLWEAWAMMEKTWFRYKIDYDLTDSGKDALDKLKRYFSKDNLVKRIRDNYAFHYGNDILEKIPTRIETTTDDEVFDIYLSKLTVNCFFPPAMVLTLEMLKSINPNDAWKALEQLRDEVMDTAELWLEFLKAFISFITSKDSIKDGEEIIIPEPPTFDDVKLPCFVRVN